MANRLDIVAIEVADERAEVVRLVVGPQPGHSRGSCSDSALKSIGRE
jgi:hypothetical protein